MHLYLSLHEAYGWTHEQADQHAMSWILDLLIVKAKIAGSQEEQIVPIDSVL